MVETAFRAWNRGDRDGWLAPMHPEVEWSSAIQRQVEGAETVYSGQAELAYLSPEEALEAAGISE